MNKNLKVALVHDYVNEYGGAERVLEALSEIWPEAPIYTAFIRKNSTTYNRLKHKKIVPSWAQYIPWFSSKLHSPLRFLAPLIWESFDLSEFEVVISSSSWYITKGVRVPKEGLHISYIHTPPRYLYGYDTSINWRKYGLVRLYAMVVNKFLRQYDYETAQRVDCLVANSVNVQKRIKKYYRKDSVVIYPPVDLAVLKEHEIENTKSETGYFLIISRLVGGKGLGMAVEAANRLKVPLKIVGTGAGWGREEQNLKEMAGQTIEFLGYVDDEKLAQLYAGAKAFLVLARDEDFGITPVEAMLVGTPVVAYKGGGYMETVIEGKTGIFFKDYSVDGLMKAMRQIQTHRFDEKIIIKQGQKFSKERFKQEIMALVEKEWEKKNAGVA